MITNTRRRIKPAPWGLIMGLMPPRGQALWRGCVFAAPFWSSGKASQDVGSYRLASTLGTALNGSTSFVGTPYGIGINFTNLNAQSRMVFTDPARNILDGFAAFSIETIIRPVATTGTQGIIGKYEPTAGKRAWRLYIEGGELELQVSSDGAANETKITSGAAAAGLAAGAWVQIVVTWNAGVFAVYLNGKSVAVSGNFTATSIFAAAMDLWLGMRTDTNGMNGRMASARIWNRVLSAGEVAELSSAPWAMYEPMPLFPPPAVEHIGSSPSGPWELVGEVAKGDEAFFVPGINGMSYDIQLRTVDTSGNESAGDTPASATPAAAAAAWRGRFNRMGPRQRQPRGRR